LYSKLSHRVVVVVVVVVHEKTRQEMIQFKSPILLTLGANVGHGE